MAFYLYTFVQQTMFIASSLLSQSHIVYSIWRWISQGLAPPKQRQSITTYHHLEGEHCSLWPSTSLITHLEQRVQAWNGRRCGQVGVVGMAVSAQSKIKPAKTLWLPFRKSFTPRKFLAIRCILMTPTTQRSLTGSKGRQLTLQCLKVTNRGIIKGYSH